ncbi:hypothetical protein DTO012A7_8747 [Penicillium roqueforti]|uniref:uncharacterized protein n=1 Tax=Penicillium roqueforti TaxID=5082 RepID=UPI00190D93D7|nr:uncharacterized protein LCP9604111_6950 [Penicillium roqueforti]KAF9245092.1 hypothetical protein LCP9604111_6950 [Penicillium roqueforti]KAI3222319.1 hypothetical protein DTO012A7_8747 [Penicillium roqueforti]
MCPHSQHSRLTGHLQNLLRFRTSALIYKDFLTTPHLFSFPQEYRNFCVSLAVCCLIYHRNEQYIRTTPCPSVVQLVIFLNIHG